MWDDNFVVYEFQYCSVFKFYLKPIMILFNVTLELKVSPHRSIISSNWPKLSIGYLSCIVVGRCTAPWSLVHIRLVFEHWRNPISYRNRCTNCTRSQKLLFLIELGVSGDRALYIKLSTWEKNSALCGTEGKQKKKKKKWFFFCSRHTRKINWGFFLGRLYGCYLHRELKYHSEKSYYRVLWWGCICS